MNSADRVGGWKNQYARMRRWGTRAITALSDLPRTDFHTASDTTLAYFVWCHSLRDWLIKDNALTAEQVNIQLRKHSTWKMVRDLANRSKHLTITQNPTDSEWSVAREYDPFALLIEGRERHHLNLYFQGQKYRLAQVVTDSDDMWRQVLSDTNMV